MDITIIDDNIHLANNIKKGLEKKDHKVHVYHSRAEFLGSWNFITDVFLMDINLWDGNGLDLVEHLRQIEKISTPIIMISAQTSSDIKKEGFQAWANDYIEKPFTMDDILERIDTVFSKISAQNTNESCQKYVFSCLSEKEKHKMFQ